MKLYGSIASPYVARVAMFASGSASLGRTIMCSGDQRRTNPETRGVLTQLVHDVVQPLGPTLLQVPDPPARVALLESFASQVFAQRGTPHQSAPFQEATMRKRN